MAPEHMLTVASHVTAGFGRIDIEMDVARKPVGHRPREDDMSGRFTIVRRAFTGLLGTALLFALALPASRPTRASCR